MLRLSAQRWLDPNDYECNGCDRRIG